MHEVLQYRCIWHWRRYLTLKAKPKSLLKKLDLPFIFEGGVLMMTLRYLWSLSLRTTCQVARSDSVTATGTVSPSSWEKFRNSSEALPSPFLYAIKSDDITPGYIYFVRVAGLNAVMNCVYSLPKAFIKIQSWSYSSQRCGSKVDFAPKAQGSSVICEHVNGSVHAAGWAGTMESSSGQCTLP